MTRRDRLVLHFFPSFAFGGQQKRLGALVRGLGQEYVHRIFAFDGDTSAAELVAGSRASVAALQIEKSKLVSVRNVRKIAALIRSSGADLICTYNFGSIEAVIANRLGPNLPHVHHEDGFGPDEAGGRQKITRVIARRLLLGRSIVTVPSAVLERTALETWKLPAGRLRRIGVGIPLAKFTPKGDATERNGPVVVGSIGALRAEKNFARLIRSFKIAADGVDARLVIHGDGPERASLEAAAAGDARISLPGVTTKPEAALATIDVFALSSDTEQTPTSLMEAMAAGLPTISTDVGDVRSMVPEQSTAFVIPAASEADYARSLRQLLIDAEERRRLGAANRVRAASFDERAMIEAFRSLYREAAEGSNR